MTVGELINVLDSLLALPAETEVVEFKKAENQFDDRDLGKYFSALSNEANLKGRPCAWLVFGVENESHSVVGSNYKTSRPSLDAMKKKIADQTTGRHTFAEIYEFRYTNNKRVIMFEIPPAPRGIPVAYQNHYYGREGESLQRLSIDKIERIRSQAVWRDWSAETIDGASLADLDPAAIARARELYAAAHVEKAAEVASWDDATFLNKAKITIKGRITNAAVVLLGKEESEHLISPSVAKIKWILRGRDNVERDYMIASCPFIFAVDRIYERIRNLKYRYINPDHKTLFPEEIDTYEPYVIREALNNAIAHQDYTLCGQINVVEYDDKLVFSNRGAFIPGNIERVLVNDAPEEIYRNQFLVSAMVGLK
ncbi:MAG: putative DNA binding domain-containing protein, partial [Bacteroidales bacterium]|nr:putative DNA binding domain-containing protein [Bacteroidales bacterium]